MTVTGRDVLLAHDLGCGGFRSLLRSLLLGSGLRLGGSLSLCSGLRLGCGLSFCLCLRFGGCAGLRFRLSGCASLFLGPSCSLGFRGSLRLGLGLRLCFRGRLRLSLCGSLRLGFRLFLCSSV